MMANGWNCITNSTDDTIKLWDIRNPSHFIASQYFHSNFIPPTKMSFNGDETLIVTANHHFNKMQEIEQQTELVFYNTSTLEEYARIPSFDVAVTDIVWHSILNQIFVGGMDGNIRALFNPLISRKGCMLCIGRQTKYIHVIY
jgi:WD40 repeat protein